MRRRLLFSATWIAVVFIMMIMTFTLSFATTGTSPANQVSTVPLEGSLRDVLQKDLNRNTYPPFNSPANPWLNQRKESTNRRGFVKQTWTSIDGKNYRPLNAGTKRYLFKKASGSSK